MLLLMLHCQRQNGVQMNLPMRLVLFKNKLIKYVALVLSDLPDAKRDKQGWIDYGPARHEN